MKYNESNKKSMSFILAKIYSNANLVVHSQVPARILERKTKLNHSTILRIRKNRRSLSQTTLRTCLCLSAYPAENIDFDQKELWSIFEQSINYIPVSHLSHLLNIPRITLERLKKHQAKLLNTNIMVTIKLVDFYKRYVEPQATVLADL